MGASAAAVISTIVSGASAAGSAVAGAAGTAAGQAAIGGVASAAVGALGSKLLAPKPPGQQPKSALPDQASIEEARRRSLTAQRQRSGRASTILTANEGDTLGS